MISTIKKVAAHNSTNSKLILIRVIAAQSDEDPQNAIEWEE